MDLENQLLIDLVRKSRKNHEIINKYFNPNHECFGCLFISNFPLKNACNLKNINLEEVISQLDK